jgi:hypothetical protein
MFTRKIFKQNTGIMGIIHETFKPKQKHKVYIFVGTYTLRSQVPIAGRMKMAVTLCSQ